MSPPTSPVPQAFTAVIRCTNPALGHMSFSGWCVGSPPYLPLCCTPPVTCPSWPLVWVWPGPVTPAWRLSHFESTFRRHHRPWSSWSGTQLSLVDIPKIVPPCSFPQSQTWLVLRWVLCLSQIKLASKRCSCYQIIFLFCLRPTASSPSSSRQTSPFSQAFDS